jgi:hypothetical protein
MFCGIHPPVEATVRTEQVSVDKVREHVRSVLLKLVEKSRSISSLEVIRNPKEQT